MVQQHELTDVMAAMRRAVPLGQGTDYVFVIVTQQQAQQYLQALQALQAAIAGLGSGGSGSGGALVALPPPTVSYNAPASIDIGPSTTEVLKAGVQRRFVLLLNTSSVTIWVGIGYPAVVGSGIRLTAGGGWASWGGYGGLPMFDRSQALNAISESGTQTIPLTTAG